MPRLKRTLWAALPCLTLAAIGLAANQPIFAQSDVVSTGETVVPITAHRTELEMIEKFTKVLESKSRIVRVNGFDPVVLNVSALTATRISVTAMTQGVTSLVITDEEGHNFAVDVYVKGDARALQTIIDKKFPNSSVEAFKVQDAVVLRGWVSSPEHITQIAEIAEQFYTKVLNQMRVGGVQQVLLKVKVMEAQRSVIRQLGMNFTYLNRNGYLSSNPGNITSIASAALPLGGPPSVATSAGTLSGATGSFGVVGDNSTFQSFLSALREETLLKILAEPEVVATNGRPATLLSGGEFPILVPQGLGTVAIEWRQFGVRMEAVPTVLGGGGLRLDLQPEVSDRDFTNAVTVGGLTVPGLTVRRVNTQVEMKFGQTLMLAGLISTRQSASMHKVPFLGELPYIGTAFNRKRFDDAETEVVITVTPELVAPLDESQVPAGGPGLFGDKPTDRELMLYNLTEVPKIADRCETCQPGNGGPYIVPGLKGNARDSQSSAPQSPPPTGRDRNELILPPPRRDDQSQRTTRTESLLATRRQNDSAIRKAGFDAAANESRPSRAAIDNRGDNRSKDSPRSSEPPRNSASSSPTRNYSAIQPAGEARVSPSESSKPATTNRTSSTIPSKKPGLIEPPPR